MDQKWKEKLEEEYAEIKYGYYKSSVKGEMIAEFPGQRAFNIDKQVTEYLNEKMHSYVKPLTLDLLEFYDLDIPEKEELLEE